MTEGIVIVGAGLCGGNAAVTLRDEGYRERVVLVGDEPGIPFGRPPLSKSYLQGTEDLGGWQVKPADWYESNDVERIASRVIGLDPSAHEVILENQKRVLYDRLLIATGGASRRLRVPGAALRRVFSLRTQQDCDAIRAAAEPGRRAVVVGMGFIGAEVAASLRQLGLRVAAVSSGIGPLAAVLGDEVAGVLGAVHRENEVELVTHDHAVAFTGDDGYAQAVVTEKGERLDCDFVVVGAGIEPALGLLAGSGVAIDNGVLVDEQCRSSIQDVFAAGDVANHQHPIFGRVRVEHYNNAERQGRAAARNMLGSDEPYADLHSFWSDQYEHKIEYIGHAPHWDHFVVRGSLEGRAFLGFYLEAGEVRAAVGMNRGGDPEVDLDGEMSAAGLLVRAQTSVDPAALSDEGVDLRDLAAATGA